MFGRRRTVEIKYERQRGRDGLPLSNKQSFTFRGQVEGNLPMVSQEESDLLTKGITFCLSKESEQNSTCQSLAELSGKSYLVELYKNNSACLHVVSGPNGELTRPVLCGKVSDIQNFNK